MFGDADQGDLKHLRSKRSPFPKRALRGRLRGCQLQDWKGDVSFSRRKTSGMILDQSKGTEHLLRSLPGSKSA